VRVGLKIIVFHGSRDASSVVGVVLWCCGSAMEVWFLTKDASFLLVVTAWRVGGGCVVKNVGYVADLLEEERDYLAAFGCSNLIVDYYDM